MDAAGAGKVPSLDHAKRKEIQLRLISVELKEASIDSPSFRASVNFFHTRVVAFEAWLDQHLSFAESQYNGSFGSFKRVYDALLSQLLPSPVLLGNGAAMNQAHLPMLADSFNRDFHDFTMKMFDILLEDVNDYSRALRELMDAATEPYRQCRKNFVYYQNKYDTMLANSQATNVLQGTIDPNILMEDAFHIFDIKKNYLEASLELVNVICTCRLRMDKFLVDTMESIISKNYMVLKETKLRIDLTPAMQKNFQEYRLWVDEEMETNNIFQNDMNSVKGQLLEHTVAKITPSRELANYNLKELNPSKLEQRSSNSIPSGPPQKSGWLFLKTTVGANNREVWVRRWCFIQNSVFGIFLLSPCKTAVEETDKFGVLLLDIRLTPQPTRKFCFEVIISLPNAASPLTLALQTESLRELKSWFKSFHNAQRFAKTLSKDSFQYSMANSRVSPQFEDFLCSSITSVDKKLIAPAARIKIVDRLNLGFDEHDTVVFSTGQMRFCKTAMTPITTKMTQLAILAFEYLQQTIVPSAAVANIWGTTDWAEYSVGNQQLNTMKAEQVTLQNNVHPIYPKDYPERLKFCNLQFRSLFLSFNHGMSLYKDEVVLVTFSSFWCPNKTQRFSTSCYITSNHLYIYMNSMGFVSIIRRNYTDMVCVEIDRTNPRLLNIYTMDSACIQVVVYLSDINIVASQMQFLIENSTREVPLKSEELYAKMIKIEREYKERDNSTEIVSQYSTNEADEEKLLQDKKMDASSKLLLSINNDTVEIMSRFNKFPKLFTKNYQGNHTLSCRKLFHVLFGDQSDISLRSLLLVEKSSKYNVAWYWKVCKASNGETQLVRKLQLELKLRFVSSYNDNKFPYQKKNSVIITQRVRRMLEGRYYEVDQDPVVIKIPFCHYLRFGVKYVVAKFNSSKKGSAQTAVSVKSLFSIYYKVDFFDPVTGKVVKKLNLMERFAKSRILQFSRKEARLFNKNISLYLKKIGKHHQQNRVFRYCGLISFIGEDIRDELFVAEQESDSAMNGPTICFSSLVIINYLLGLLITTLYRSATTAIRIILRLLVSLVSQSADINKTLAMCLLFSTICNVFLLGRMGYVFSKVKRAENILRQPLQNEAATSMDRTISLSQLDELTANTANDDAGSAFAAFKKLNVDKSHIYQESRYELELKRNQLLTHLKMLENMDRDLVAGQYRKFLISDLNLCRKIKGEMQDVWANDTALHKYCHTCSEELNGMSLL